jgi:regulator of protease activity HflC (stomatin/prohibitin superfamily)
MVDLNIGIILALVFTAFLILNLALALKVIREGEIGLVERLGKYTQKPLEPGLNLLIPFIDKLVFRADVRQQRSFFDLKAFTIEGSEVSITSAISWRILDAGEAYYRDQNIEEQLVTQGGDLLRSAVGKMNIRELNSSRDALKTEIAEALQQNTQMLGVAVVSFMIQEIVVPENIQHAMDRAFEANEDKTVTQTNADAVLYEKKREADGIKVTSEARSYELETIAKVIKAHGRDTIDYDVAIRQVKAIGEIGASDSTKSIILPTNVTESLGTLETVLHYLRDHLPTDTIQKRSDDTAQKGELVDEMAVSTEPLGTTQSQADQS